MFIATRTAGIIASGTPTSFALRTRNASLNRARARTEAAAAGILTARGGRTAHAAVVARQLGKVCVVGCHDLVP